MAKGIELGVMCYVVWNTVHRWQDVVHTNAIVSLELDQNGKLISAQVCVCQALSDAVSISGRPTRTEDL